MFDQLTRRLGSILDGMRGKNILKESTVVEALREIRIALIEADVALPVIKVFIERVKEKAIGEAVLKSVQPAHMVTQIVHQELINLLDHAQRDLIIRQGKPSVFLLMGLQGSGKTTMCGKLAYLVHQMHPKQRILMFSTDIYRPAAQHQLSLIGQSLKIDTLDIRPDEKPSEIARRGIALNYDVYIVDTAGRLHIDAAMMQELVNVASIVNPHETLFVADALSGQDALRTGLAFQEALPMTGIALSRIDGDSRGGSALSLVHGLGQPIKLMGLGELPQQVEIFDPKRLADRILDRGDIIGLVEKAAAVMNQEQQEKEISRLKKGIFTLEDFAQKIEMMERMGGMKSLLNLLPGMKNLKEQVQEHAVSTDLKKQLAIIQSMTHKERRQPELLNASRKRRVAAGSGTSVAEINTLLRRFQQMQKMMKMLPSLIK